MAWNQETASASLSSGFLNFFPDDLMMDFPPGGSGLPLLMDFPGSSTEELAIQETLQPKATIMTRKRSFQQAAAAQTQRDTGFDGFLADLGMDDSNMYNQGRLSPGGSGGSESQRSSPLVGGVAAQRFDKPDPVELARNKATRERQRRERLNDRQAMLHTGTLICFSYILGKICVGIGGRSMHQQQCLSWIVEWRSRAANTAVRSCPGCEPFCSSRVAGRQWK